MEHLWRDLGYTLRTCARKPGFTSAIVLTLALGIASNTAVFSVINAIFLRPLPGVAEPGRLVSLYRFQDGQLFDGLSYPDYRDYRDRSQSFLALAAHCPAAISFTYGGAERMIGDLVTGNYFSVLGVRPAAGRLLLQDDDSGVVISYGLWNRKFGASPGAIGARIELNGDPFTIVGVAEPGFRGTMLALPLDLWVPLHNQPRLMPRMSRGVLENRAAGWLQLFGRLKPGVGLQSADAEIRTIAAQLALAYPVTNGKRTAGLSAGVGMDPDDRAEVGGLLALLSGAVALLLFTACANAAGMLLLRAIGRTREMAIRLALGATRGRILTQLLGEGLLLALVAAALGVLLAAWATQAILAANQGAAPSVIRSAGAHVDATVLTFTILATAFTGLLVALAPMLQSLKVDLTSALKSGLPGSGIRGMRLRSVLVAGQVALSLVLLGAAGLLLGSLYSLVSANPGFDASHIAMATVDLSLQRYSEAQGQAFYAQLLDRLRGTPGVLAAGIATSVPPTEWPGAVSIFHPGEEPTQEVLQGREFELGTRVNINQVSPDYFRTLGISILEGRDFTATDRAGGPGVVIVSQNLARRMWPGEDPIGKQIAYPRWQGPPRPPFEVIGVAADVKHIALTRTAPLLLYVPASQEYTAAARVVVRTAADPAAGIAQIQRAVAATDKTVAVYAPQTGPEHSADTLWRQRMAAGWIAAFSLMALLLAAVGLYAIIAQSVVERTHELGIRMALGANPRRVAALVIRQGLFLALAGLLVGLPAALGFTRLIRGRLEGIAPADPWNLTAIVLLLLLVMLLACWIPARRAARIDPTEALRCE